MNNQLFDRLADVPDAHRLRIHYLVIAMAFYKDAITMHRPFNVHNAYHDAAILAASLDATSHEVN